MIPRLLAFFLPLLLLLAGAGIFLLAKNNPSSPQRLPSQTISLSSKLQNTEKPAAQSVRTLAEHIGSPSFGSENPSVTIVEFLDFQCPFCRQAAPTVKDLMTLYQGKPVRFIFRQLPLMDIHPFAYDAAHASLCAHEQGRFLPLHDLLYERQDQISKTAIASFASSLGLNLSSYNTCMAEERYRAQIQKDIDDAVALGVAGTPTFFINGQLLAGALPLETLRGVIDGLLKKGTGD